MTASDSLSSASLFRRLLRYSFRYWRGFLFAVLAMIVTASTETAFPALMKKLMDTGFKGEESFSVVWVPAVILGLFLFRGLATFVATYSMEWVSNNTLRDIRQAMFEKLIALPTKSFDSSSSGLLISKMISEAQQVLMAATNVVTVIVRDSLVLIGLMGWLLWINWQLTLVVLGIVPPLAYMTRKFSSRMRRVSGSYLGAVGEMTRSVEEVISGNRVVKIYTGETFESERFRSVNAKFRAQAMRYAIASALQSPASQLIAALGVSIVVTIVLLQARSGAATIGDFVSFLTAMLLMFGPLKHLADVNASLQKGLAAAERVFALLDEHSEYDGGETTLGRVRGEIMFRDVVFTYPTRDTAALKKINLTIPAGETYALVGPSGSGKTTLVNLLPRLYDISSGSITIDGIELRDIKLKSLRDQFALVSQDVVLFNDTIAKNIAYSQPDISIEKIKLAAEAADLGDFLASLPDGLETQIGDRGVRVSGGQRQRIALARAILKDAPILILDEATSALDTASEYRVQQAIENLRKNRTTLVVAHRLSTVINADKIVVMDAGQIVQQGKHVELLEQVGLYKTLYSKFVKSE